MPNIPPSRKTGWRLGGALGDDGLAGLMEAAATLVGQALGRGEPEDAYLWGWDVSRVGVAIFAVLGAVFDTGRTLLATYNTLLQLGDQVAPALAHLGIDVGLLPPTQTLPL